VGGWAGPVSADLSSRDRGRQAVHAICARHGGHRLLPFPSGSATSF
jgi:hypothetical protein